MKKINNSYLTDITSSIQHFKSGGAVKPKDPPKGVKEAKKQGRAYTTNKEIIDHLLKDFSVKEQNKILSYLDKVAYHESAKTFDPRINQNASGPAVSQYQYEKARFTDVKRHIPEAFGEADILPEWLVGVTKTDNYKDLKKLNTIQQTIVTLIELTRKGNNTTFQKFLNGEISDVDFWQRDWNRSKSEDVPARNTAFVNDEKLMKEDKSYRMNLAPSNLVRRLGDVDNDVIDKSRFIMYPGSPLNKPEDAINYQNAIGEDVEYQEYLNLDHDSQQRLYGSYAGNNPPTKKAIYIHDFLKSAPQRMSALEKDKKENPNKYAPNPLGTNPNSDFDSFLRPRSQVYANKSVDAHPYVKKRTAKDRIEDIIPQYSHKPKSQPPLATFTDE